MPLKINSKHSSRHNSIEELYQERFNNCEADYIRERYTQMIELSRLINKMFPKTEIWALTSVERLVLMNQDNWESDWYVIIENIGTKEFFFEYLIPKDNSPWENAYVKGVASSFEKAKIYLLKSMRECRGWEESEELKMYCDTLL